jgi:hypothetical protein
MVLGGGMAAIPGSTARNLFLQNMQAGRVAQDQEAAKSASDLAYQQAQTQNLTNPRDEFTPLSTDQGYVAFDRSTAATKPVVDAQGNPIAAPVKATEPHYTTMPDGSIVAMTQNASGKITASTVLKGTPAQKLSVQDLQVGGKPHKVIIDENTGATIKDLGESGIKPPTVNVNASIPGLSSGVTGDEFLSTLPAGMRSQVAAMANGDIAIPTPSARNPQAQQLRTAVMQYDPTYTDARYKGKQNFKTSGDAQNIVQLSTAMEHADHAIANSPKVGFAPMLGNPKFESGDSAAYMQDAEFLTGEVGKLVNGGVLSVEEGRKLSSGLTAARQSVRDAAVNETMDLLGGKARAVFQKYKIATGQDLPIKEFFDPKTQQRLTKYRVLEGDQGQANLGGNPMAPPKQASSVSVTAPDGSVHTFKDQATADQFKQLTGVK